MKAIIATNDSWTIGLNNKLPWRCREDLAHFKKMTMGCKLMVGRVTYESMPPLKGREIIVVGKGYNTLEEALSQKPDWVIGGKRLYESTLHLCSEFHVSFIDNKASGDTDFPSLKEFGGKFFIYNFKEDEI